MNMQTDNTLDLAGAFSVFNAQRVGKRGARSGRRDPRTIRNERIKLGSSFLNAIGLTLIAFALLRPITQDLSALTPLSFFWVGMGLVLHFGAHVMLGRLSDDAPERD